MSPEVCTPTVCLNVIPIFFGTAFLFAVLLFFSRTPKV